MTTTTTYRDQHTPAKVGFFMPLTKLGITGIAAYPLEKLQSEMTRQSLISKPGQSKTFQKSALYAGAARVALTVVDEFLIDNGGEYEA